MNVWNHYNELAGQLGGKKEKESKEGVGTVSKNKGKSQNWMRKEREEKNEHVE